MGQLVGAETGLYRAQRSRWGGLGSAGGCFAEVNFGGLNEEEVDAYASLVEAVRSFFVVCCASALVPAAAHADAVTFNPTGAEQPFTVPAGVASIHVVAVGAPGGAGAPFGPGSAGGSGANGATAVADLAVTPERAFMSRSGVRAPMRREAPAVPVGSTAAERLPRLASMEAAAAEGRPTFGRCQRRRAPLR
jgi:hypothetical protein